MKVRDKAIQILDGKIQDLREKQEKAKLILETESRRKRRGELTYALTIIEDLRKQVEKRL
jgi:hypothetical protein